MRTRFYNAEIDICDMRCGKLWRLNARHHIVCTAAYIGVEAAMHTVMLSAHQSHVLETRSR